MKNKKTLSPTENAALLEIKLQHVLRQYAIAKIRSDDLAEIVDNHLNPSEVKHPLSESSIKAFESISGSYYKLLSSDKRGGKCARMEQREYGFTPSKLAQFMQVSLDTFMNKIAIKELPRPMSVFNGEVKYNLMQVGVILRKEDSWLINGDQTKHWYAHLLVDAKKKTEQKESYANSLRNSIRTCYEEAEAAKLHSPSQEVVQLAPPAPADLEPSTARPPAIEQTNIVQQAQVVQSQNVKAPAIASLKIPIRKKNTDYRTREYLTEPEIEQLMVAAGRVGRHGHRDATIILLSFRHGLSVTELVSLRWDQIDFEKGLVQVSRLRNNKTTEHLLRGPELRALRRLQRDYQASPYVFYSERKAPLTDDAIRKIVGRAGNEAKLPFTVHPHMLRHSCGHKMALAGYDAREIQHYLGLNEIQHTLRYFETPVRPIHIWKD